MIALSPTPSQVYDRVAVTFPATIADGGAETRTVEAAFTEPRDAAVVSMHFGPDDSAWPALRTWDSQGDPKVDGVMTGAMNDLAKAVVLSGVASTPHIGETPIPFEPNMAYVLLTKGEQQTNHAINLASASAPMRAVLDGAALLGDLADNHGQPAGTTFDELAV